MWAISNSAACLKVSVKAQLSRTLELIIFFFKTQCCKAPWPEGAQCVLQSVVWNTTHLQQQSPLLPELFNIWDPTATWNTAQTVSEVVLWLQCLGCLIQFRIIHFWPEHLWTTRRRPKLASLDISTSKQRPVSLLMIGPFCNKNAWKYDNLCTLPLRMKYLIIFGVFEVVARVIKKNMYFLYLCKVPKSLGDPWNSVTFFQSGSASSAIINKTFCVRQESGRPQGS